MPEILPVRQQDGLRVFAIFLSLLHVSVRRENPGKRTGARSGGRTPSGTSATTSRTLLITNQSTPRRRELRPLRDTADGDREHHRGRTSSHMDATLVRVVPMKVDVDVQLTVMASSLTASWQGGSETGARTRSRRSSSSSSNAAATVDVVVSYGRRASGRRGTVRDRRKAPVARAPSEQMS